MANPIEKLTDLEHKFWDSIKNQDVDSAVGLLNEPAVLVSAHGSMKFDHAGFRKMAEQGSMVLTAFEFSGMDVVFPNDTTAILTYHVKQTMAPRDKSQGIIQEMNDTSTWIQVGKRWRCVMHTETPAESKGTTH
jgi:hypothetical protein